MDARTTKPSTPAVSGPRPVAAPASSKPGAAPVAGAARVVAPAKAPSPAAPKVDVDPLMAALVESSAQVTRKACPHCQAFVKNEAALCTHCGHNFSTGHQLRTRTSVEKVKQPKVRSSRSFSITLSPGLTHFLVGLLVPLIPIALGAGMKSEGLVAVGFGVGLLVGVVYGLWTIVAAFQAGVLHGVGCIFLGFIYQLVFLILLCEDNRVRGGWFGSLLAGAAMGAMVGLGVIDTPGAGVSAPTPPGQVDSFESP